MNKICKILILISLTLFIVGCSDDDDNNDIQKLRIVKSDTEYASLGGTGTIEFEAIEAVVATSSQNWCKPTVSGNKISLNVDPNTDINGRHAAITIKSGDETAMVTITQLGTTFLVDKTTLELPLAGGSDKIVYQSEKPVTVSVKPSDNWLSYNINTSDNSITFTAIGGSSDKSAEVEVSSGILKKTIIIRQVLSYDDLVGDWTLTGLNGSDAPVTNDVKIAVNVQGESFSLTGIAPAPTAKYILTYNPQTKKIVFQNPTYFGRYDFTNLGTYYVFACIFSPSTGNLTWNAAVQYEGTIDTGATNITYKFSDNGSWSGHVAEGFYNGLFTGNEPSGFYNQASYGILKNIVIVKK